MGDKIEPCPVCGKPVKSWQTGACEAMNRPKKHYVGCEPCGCWMTHVFKDEAIRLWNRCAVRPEEEK